MSNRVSHSAVATYAECGKKYRLHYIDRLRSKVISGALLFGSSIDHALNLLIKEKNLEESIKLFDKSFRFQNINNEGTYIPNSTKVVYSERDFDFDLLTQDDIKKIVELKVKNGMGESDDIKSNMEYLRSLKKEKGIKGFTFEEHQLYSFANWSALRQKGILMLKEYNENIIPKIKEVLAIQKSINITNGDGDTIIGYIDLIVKWEDDKVYIMDNKTSTREYEPDSAMRSQQLILYYHATKEEYKANGVGFIVMSKVINKNKTKQCEKCGKDGTGQRHKTCDNLIADTTNPDYNINGDDKTIGKRCNGAWIETIKPKAFITTILNEVNEAAENLVIEAFDEANQGIKNKTFNPNLKACGSHKDFLCQFYKKCWTGSDEDLIQLENKE